MATLTGGMAGWRNAGPKPAAQLIYWVETSPGSGIYEATTTRPAAGVNVAVWEETSPGSGIYEATDAPGAGETARWINYGTGSVLLEG